MAKFEDIQITQTQFAEGDAPATPASGIVRLYAKADGKLYCKDDAGTESTFGGSSPLTTKGDVFVYGSADGRLPIGTDGQVLTVDSAQALGVKWAAAGGGIILVADSAIDSAVTSVTIDGFTMDKTNEYLLVSNWINGGSTSTMSILFNGLSASSFYSQSLTAYGATVASERGNNANMEALTANQSLSCRTRIRLTNNGYISTTSQIVAQLGSTGIALKNVFATSTSTATSITSVTISASVSSCIAAGSRFQLYKIV